MNRDSLLDTLNKATANAVDVYFDLYTNYFENSDRPQEALKIILEYPKKIGDIEDKNPQSIMRRDEYRITLIYEEIISGTASRIAEMNLTKEEFYKKLYTTIFDSESDLYPRTKEEKVIALKILSERTIAVPYYQIIEIEKISEEDFGKAANNLKPAIQEAFCMMQRQFATIPEEAAQIMRIADNISDRKERIVFWSVIIKKLRSNGED